MESVHFKYEVIPAGRWSRIRGTMPRGDSDEARPHLIPKTELAERLVSLDASGLAGHTGLCPGEVTLDGSKKMAYRFIRLKEEDAKPLLRQLDNIIDDLVEKAASDWVQ